MKISIWQQFSSNHSSHFTVVGKFPSVEAAQKAETEIRDVLTRIWEWWESLSPDDQALWIDKVNEQRQITPVEAEIAQKYGVEWHHGLDRYIWFWSLEAYDPVQNFEQFLFVQNPGLDEFWRGPQPFNHLLAKFGAEVAVNADECQPYPDTFLRLELSFLCPDLLTAELIETEIRDYVTVPDGGIPPWIVYHEGQPNPNGAELVKMAKMLFEESDLTTQIYQEKREDELKKLYDQYYARQRLTAEQSRYILDVLKVTDILFYRGKEEYLTSRLDGLELAVSWIIYTEYYADCLSAITAWLKDMGCSQIDINFIEVPIEVKS